jgi:hypothetical protein
MNLSLIRRLTCLAALALLIGGPALNSVAQDDPPKSKKKAPKPDPDDDDVIVPGKKAKAPAAGGKSLVSLIKQANLRYETTEMPDGNTGYKIPITVKGQKTTVLAYEVTMGQTNDGEAIKAVIAGSPVASFPEEYRATIPLYKAIGDFNDKFVFGKGLVNQQGVAFVCPFWLRNADTQTLMDHLYMVHLGRVELKKRVQPIFEEE